jgi:hypothetical protein
MAARRTRRKSARRSRAPKTLNLAGIAESALIANGGSFGTMSQIKAGGGSTGVRPYMQTVGSPFGLTVRDNLANNGAAMVGQLILIPAGFKVFTKLTRKPRSTMNKALKMSGLPVRV